MVKTHINRIKNKIHYLTNNYLTKNKIMDNTIFFQKLSCRGKINVWGMTGGHKKKVSFTGLMGLMGLISFTGLMGLMGLIGASVFLIFWHDRIYLQDGPV
jgi:hypothetical protein